MPNPKDYDNEKDWMAACVPMRIEEGNDQDQAVAACMSMWRDRNKEKHIGDYLLDQFVTVKPGAPFRLFPFGKLVKGGKERDITPELAALFKMPHFKPAIKLGSHDDITPAGGHIIGLEVRQDGLYAVPEYNEKGLQAVQEGAYRYQSPEVIWPGGGIEDPQTGAMIEGPLIVGAALLHTPHLGEAAALYSVNPMMEVNDMTETVAVPANLWDKFMAWFDRSTAEPDPPATPVVEPEKFEALQKERDDLAARIMTLEAEQAKQARIDAFAAQLKETKVSEGAELLAAMSDEQAAWVVQQFKALSAQINESALLGEIGSDGAGAEQAPGVAFDAAIRAKMETDKLDYFAAAEAVALVNPELAKAARVAAKPKKEE